MVRHINLFCTRLVGKEEELFRREPSMLHLILKYSNVYFGKLTFVDDSPARGHETLSRHES